MQNYLSTKRKDEKKGVLERAIIKQKECMSKSESSGAKNFSVWLTVQFQSQQRFFSSMPVLHHWAIIARWGKRPLTGFLALVKILNLYISGLLIYKNEVKYWFYGVTLSVKGDIYISNWITPFPGFFPCSFSSNSTLSHPFIHPAHTLYSLLCTGRYSGRELG